MAAPLPTPEVDPALAATLAAEEPPARRPLPPTLVARYEDLAFVGEGGMGVVYRGRDPRLGRMVALKLIKGDDPALWRRFIQEARAQARVVHENVCRIYEAGQADGEPFVVMQLIDGEPLSRLGRTITLEQGVKLMAEVAAAVHEAHRLGLIHRDLKPQNILVEMLPDGALKPYVVDFGLAREVAERGQTVTGAVVGTPAYMPPEQALGDLRAMDRRSDVYALGATLYDLVAGRPPFSDEHPWKLLMKVAYEDPPALSRVKKGVPSDLDTIVMKCLERDPSRRYESSRALAEDLQRFLDGEPIRARRASLPYVAWKKARKHKLASALSLAAALAAMSLSAVWAKGRRDAAEQARLVQALGEDVKGMELFLRNAYGMPLHDVERERDLVRGKLARIEQEMKAAGRVGEGPGHYAMGRGHLALGDPAAARDHLEKARAAGYASAALDVALGQALGELFRRAIEETKRITNEEERKKRVAALEVELRDPALGRLRAAVGAEIEAPAYVEGLIALYEGKNEEAIEKAKAAFQAAPWLYEARKLEGDAHYALGSAFRHDAAFDWDRMMAHFQPAADAYRAAADLARSDPEVHRAECELWEKIGWAEKQHPGSKLDAFHWADVSCARAVAASHADARARVQQALVMSARVTGMNGEGALVLAGEAVRVAEAAARESPGDVMARYAAARAESARLAILFELNQEADAGPVITAYQQVVALDPQFTWAISELGDALYVAAEIARRRDLDPRDLRSSALEQYDRAAVLDPAFTVARVRRVRALSALAFDEIDRGAGNAARVSAVAQAVDEMERRGSLPWLVAFYRLRALRSRALLALARGEDPREALQAARAVARPFATEAWTLIELAECALLEASHAIGAGLPVRPLVEEARTALKAAGIAETDDGRVLAARVEILAIRDAVRRGEARDETFEAGIAAISPDVAMHRPDLRPRRLAAEIRARRAAWLAGKQRDPRPDLDAARKLIDSVLAESPQFAAALATSGLIALVEARTAREAIDDAVKGRPLLTRDFADR